MTFRQLRRDGGVPQRLERKGPHCLHRLPSRFEKQSAKIDLEVVLDAGGQPDAYPAVTALSDQDKQQLAALAAQRVDAFKPDFSALYGLLKSHPQIDVASMQAAKCLEKAYSAGVRIVAAKPDEIDFAITGGPAVVIRGKGGNLYGPADPSSFEKIEGEEAQMCVSAALFAAYPPRLVVVRTPEGTWQAAQ